MLLYWFLPMKIRKIAKLLMLGALLVLVCTGFLTLYIIKNIRIGMDKASLVRTKRGMETRCRLQLENGSALPFDINMIDLESEENMYEPTNVAFPIHLEPEDTLEATLKFDYRTPGRFKKLCITLVFFLVPVRFPIDFRAHG
jgi:hypothetical protein